MGFIVMKATLNKNHKNESAGAENPPPKAVGDLLRGWLEGGWALLDPQGRVTAISPALANWLGDAASCKGKPFLDLLCAHHPDWSETVQSLATEGEPVRQLSLCASDGEQKQWYQLEWARNSGGVFVRLCTVLPPQQELAEAAWDAYLHEEQARRGMFIRLMRAEAQLDNLVRRWPGVIFSQRADFSFQFVSPRIEEFTGVALAEWNRHAPRFWEVIHEADVDELKQQIKRAGKTGQAVSGAFRIRNLQTGRVAYMLEQRQPILSGNGLVLGYEGVWLDITRQTIAEKRLSSAAWKETLSVLTMGLAHDFSNIMAGIHSLSESYLSQIDKNHEFYEGLALIKEHSMQASQLIHRIVQLHHGKTGERTYSNLDEIVTGLVDLARKILPRRVEVRTVLANATLPVYVDAVEFCQVILNLTLNAADAMPKNGCLTLETSRVEEYPAMGHVEGALPKLPCMCLAVKDTGCGIPARHLAAIFDPFFTTKPMNRGSGLGLYNARLFAEKHHGAISVDSEEGKGTTFRIWLPEADFSEIERVLGAADERHSLLAVGGGGPLLDSTVEMLREQGFHVVAARSPEQARERLHSSDYRLSGIWLLIEDTRPEWAQLVEDLHQLASGLSLIVQIVGCNQDEVDAGIIQHADLLVAPNTPAPVMLEKARTLLREKEGSES